jgi:hypothetical protein
LVPGLAAVGAALREIGPGAEAHAAFSGDTAEREPAPERAAADEFWSNYEAGY